MTARCSSPIDFTYPNAARVYDFLIGGKNNFEADREEARRVLEIAPEVSTTCVANRRFMERTVRFVAEQGITQFLDLGAGLPSEPNVHQVAHGVNPEARVVYVDNDPIAATHGQALLTNGRTTMIEADLREPAAIFEHAELRRLFDLERPIGVLMLSVLQYFGTAYNPADIVARVMEATAPGSYLILSHPTQDLDGGRSAGVLDSGRHTETMGFWRGYLEILDCFSGLYLLKPGLIRTALWRPDGTDTPKLDSVWAYGGVGRKYRTAPCTWRLAR